MLKRSTKGLQIKPIRKKGSRSLGWEKFRNEQFEKDKDEEGIVTCECNRLGFEWCGVASISMDLHHVDGRDGELLYDRSKMVWLTRECHQKVHG